jgi:hypothetical protein
MKDMSNGEQQNRVIDEQAEPVSAPLKNQRMLNRSLCLTLMDESSLRDGALWLSASRFLFQG